MNWVFAHHQKIGVAAALVAAFCYVLAWIRRKKPFDEKIITPVVAVAFAGYGIPEAFLLIYCCFDDSHLKDFDDFPLYLGVAALSALILAAATIVNKFKAVLK